MSAQVDDVWEVTDGVTDIVTVHAIIGDEAVCSYLRHLYTHSAIIGINSLITNKLISCMVDGKRVDRPKAGYNCLLETCLMFGICTEEEFYAQAMGTDKNLYVILDENGNLPEAKEVNRYEDETEWLSAKDLSKYLGIGYSTALILIIKKGWFVKRDGGRSGGTAKKLCALSEIAEDFPKIVENMKSMAKPKEEKGYVDRPVQHNNKEYFCDATNGLFVTLANAVSRVGFMGFIWEEGGVERAANFCVAWRSEDGVLGFGESEGGTIEHCKAVRFSK